MGLKKALKHRAKALLFRLAAPFHLDLIPEIYWSQIYHDTIVGSGWLKDPSVSPGRAAIGYNVLYVLYRALDAARPARILELGLGQSTRVIGQYAASSGAEHIVAEHDHDWAKFFLSSYGALLKKTKIEFFGLEFRPIGGGKPQAVPENLFAGNTAAPGSGYYAYEGFTDAMKGRKFSLIMIDAPFGWVSETHARRDILPLLPGILDDDFVILLDDVGRGGEKATVWEIKDILRKNGIPFAEAFYPGAAKKDCWVIASESWKFLTTV